jgi:hypothetical protein
MTRYEVRLFLFVVIASLLYSSAQAGVCQPPTIQRESPYRYIVSLADALSYANRGSTGLALLGLDQNLPTLTCFSA